MHEIVVDQGIDPRTIRQVTLRLVPFLMLCYLFNPLDRSNIGVASLQMRPQLGLSAAAYGLGASLFSSVISCSRYQATSCCSALARGDGSHVL